MNLNAGFAYTICKDFKTCNRSFAGRLKANSSSHSQYMAISMAN